MARVNFDEFWWKDPRAEALGEALGNRRTANGWLLELLYLGQECYKKNREGIPPHLFALKNFPAEIQKYGFLESELKDGKFVIVGADDLFGWIASKVENGKRGGEQSGEVRRNDSVLLAEAKLKRNEAKLPVASSATKPLTLTPPLPLSSSLVLSPSPNTESFKNTENLGKREKKKPSAPTAVGQLRQYFLDVFEHVQKRKYPGWGKRENGMAARWLESVTLIEAKDLCWHYVRWKDAGVVREGYPFGILVRDYVKLSAWANDPKQQVKKIAEAKAIENVDIKRAIDREELHRGFQYGIEQDRRLDLELAGFKKEQLPARGQAPISGSNGKALSDEVFAPPGPANPFEGN